jgi:hypothetical protein
MELLDLNLLKDCYNGTARGTARIYCDRTNHPIEFDKLRRRRDFREAIAAFSVNPNSRIIKTQEFVTLESFSLPRTEELKQLIIGKPMTIAAIIESLDIRKGQALDLLEDVEAVEAEDGCWYIPAIEIPIAPEPTIEESIDSDRRVRSLRAENTELKRKYHNTLEQLASLERSLDTITGINEFVPQSIPNTPINKDKHEAVPLIGLSDWHVGERVKKETVNGLNEYDPDIASERAKKLFQNAITLIKKERHAVNINQAVVWLGGDFISGYIHPELMENNYLSPTQEIILAESLLSGGIELLLKEVDHLIIPCSYGNHGRMTDKSRVSTGAYNSLEWLMYHSLAKHFRDEKRITFQISEGIQTYLDVLGQTLRFAHGDFGFKYQGGIGGLAIGMNKFVANSNKAIRANMTMIGHYHTLMYNTDWCVNGSLIGAGAYSLGLGFAPERPQQIFRLIDSKYGFTGCFPLLCE